MFYVYGAYNSKATDNVELVLSVCRKPYKIFILGEDYTVHQLLRLVPGTQHLPHVYDGLKYIGGVSDLFQYLDIAEHVLGLCTTDAELHRCGDELLLFQERDLFNLLRYLKYLVDVMTQNNLIWGVGRGSSTASFVLY
jgi:hypothetical protein